MSSEDRRKKERQGKMKEREREIVCVCVWVCVCAFERERERKRWKERKSMYNSRERKNIKGSNIKRTNGRRYTFECVVFNYYMIRPLVSSTVR